MTVVECVKGSNAAVRSRLKRIVSTSYPPEIGDHAAGFGVTSEICQIADDQPWQLTVFGAWFWPASGSAVSLDAAATTVGGCFSSMTSRAGKSAFCRMQDVEALNMPCSRLARI